MGSNDNKNRGKWEMRFAPQVFGVVRPDAFQHSYRLLEWNRVQAPARAEKKRREFSANYCLAVLFAFENENICKSMVGFVANSVKPRPRRRRLRRALPP